MASYDLQLIFSSTQYDENTVYALTSNGTEPDGVSLESKDDSLIGYIEFYPLIREIKYVQVTFVIASTGISSSLIAGSYTVMAISGITWYEMLKSAHNVVNSTMSMASDGNVNFNNGKISFNLDTVITENSIIQAVIVG